MHFLVKVKSLMTIKDISQNKSLQLYDQDDLDDFVRDLRLPKFQAELASRLHEWNLLHVNFDTYIPSINKFNYRYLLQLKLRPKVQTKLVWIFLKFRIYSFVFHAEMMQIYLQNLISPN